MGLIDKMFKAQRKIGEVFYDDNTKLQCVEARNGTCKGCHYDTDGGDCIAPPDITGHCSQHLRTDKKSVIFKEAK